MGGWVAACHNLRAVPLLTHLSCRCCHLYRLIQVAGASEAARSSRTLTREGGGEAAGMGVGAGPCHGGGAARGEAADGE